MEENQHEGFGKSGADVVENNNGDDKGQGDIQRHERQQLIQSPNLFETKLCWDMFQVGNTVWSDAKKESKELATDSYLRQKINTYFS